MLKNVSGQSIGAQLITAADGSVFTGSVTVAVTGDNGTQATGSVGSGACTHEGGGYHSYAPAQAETNYDHVAFTFSGTGAISVTIQVFTDATYDRIGSTGSGLTSLSTAASITALNDISTAEVNAQVDAAIETYHLDQLLFAARTDSDIADDSVLAAMAASTGDMDDFTASTDALSALRDRGDAAWTTGGGGSLSEILDVIPMIPGAVDRANTAEYRIGFRLTNMLDDLPSTTEITPGTVQIYRKVLGGTTWANPTGYSGAQACSELAGMIYFDVEFSTANGFSPGDMLRFDFLSQSITVSSNDYVITDGTNAAIFYSGIVAENPDVNVAQVDGTAAGVEDFSTFIGTLNASGQIAAGSLAADAITAAKIQDGAITGSKIGSLTNANFGADVFDAANFAADVATEFQSGIATSAEIAALDTVVDRVEADTQDIQSRLPASLNNGVMPSDMQRINDVAVVGDGSGTPFTV